MGQSKLSVTPLASLCLGVVRGWIKVASKGKGGQIDKKGTAWTRLPADQLRDQLEREFRVEVSTRTIHRALKELTDAQLLRRQQRWKHKYRRDYWYAIPKTEEELRQQLPRTISNTQGQVEIHKRYTTNRQISRFKFSRIILLLILIKTKDRKTRKKP